MGLLAVFKFDDHPVRMDVDCPECRLRFSLFVRGDLLDRDRVFEAMDHEVLVVTAHNAPADASVIRCSSQRAD